MAGESSARFLNTSLRRRRRGWLSGIEAAYEDPPATRRDRIPINATVPAVAASQVPEVLARFPGARTAKVKVAEPGQTLADDVARVNAVRALVPTVRVDANGGWSVAQAVEAATALTADGPLEYLEQPCATVPELAELRRRVDVPIAADESIRKADDPLHVVRAEAADIAVLKVAPLGGVRKLLDIAAQIDIPIVVSSALDSAVGIGRGLLAAACAAGAAARLRTGHWRAVRRGRRRAGEAGRRLSARRAGDPGPGAARGAGRHARAPAVVDRPRAVVPSDARRTAPARRRHSVISAYGKPGFPDCVALGVAVAISAIALRHRNLEVWDDHGGVMTRVIAGDERYFQAPTADSRGELVARMSGGYSIDIFDLDTGTLTTSLPPLPDSVKTNYAFAPDGLVLVTTIDSWDSPVKLVVRDLSAQSLLASACAAAGGNLSSDEWQAFAGTTQPAESVCE